MPIKTVHITNAYHSASGGIRAFYRAMLEAANRRGRLARLVVPGERSEVEEVGKCGRIYHVAARRAFMFDKRYRLLMPATYMPPLHGELWRILRDERPDLIEVSDKYSVHWLAGLLRRGWISDLKRPPLVGMSCERMDDNVEAFLGRSRAGRLWSRFYMGYCYIPFFDYHIANSGYTAAELRGAMRARHERPVYVRPMGVDVDDFATARRSEKGRRDLIAETGGDEPETGARMMIPIQTMQEALGAAGMCSMFLVKCERPEEQEEVARRLVERLPDSRIIFTRDLPVLFAHGFAAFNVFLDSVAAMAMAISLLIILLTSYTTVTERTRQIGILKALGASKRFIAMVFIKESILVSAMGVAGGLIISLIARPALAAWAGLNIEIEAGYTLCATLGGLACGLIGAIYPALRAAGQDAVEALSYEWSCA